MDMHSAEHFRLKRALMVESRLRMGRLPQAAVYRAPPPQPPPTIAVPTAAAASSAPNFARRTRVASRASILSPSNPSLAHLLRSEVQQRRKQRQQQQPTTRQRPSPAQTSQSQHQQSQSQQPPQPAAVAATSPPTTTTATEVPIADGLVYVYEWTDDGRDIYGFGCDGKGNACRLVPHLEPGLFVVSTNTALLNTVLLGRFTFQVCRHLNYRANSFTVWDLASQPELARAPGYLVKIYTNTVAEASRLHNEFKNSANAYRYACVPHYYDVTVQMRFELLWRKLDRDATLKTALGRRKHPNWIPPPGAPPQPSEDELAEAARTTAETVALPNVTLEWFDSSLTIHEGLPAPEIPLVTFDIETVSTDRHRVPMGDEPDDRLYTVSIHHASPDNVMYTLVYLPLSGSPPAELKKRIQDDGYQVLPEGDSMTTFAAKSRNELRTFTDERDLLRATMELLTRAPKLHFLMGYNSSSYDLRFLMMRCVYYRLDEWVDRFCYRGGYSLCPEQIHIDMFRIVVMRYRMQEYSLNAVAKVLTGDSKTGVSAVALRFTFDQMMQTNEFPLHKDSTPQLPSVRDTLHYNNSDTFLVTRVESIIKAIGYTLDFAQTHGMPLSAVNDNYNKMQRKVLSKCFLTGLKCGVFLGTFKSTRVSLAVPIVTPDPADGVTLRLDDMFELNVDLTARLNEVDDSRLPASVRASAAARGSGPVATPRMYVQSSDQIGGSGSTGKGPAVYPGGINFAYGVVTADNVHIYDYQKAYPVLIDKMNLSDETMFIAPANVLLYKLPTIVDLPKFRVFDYKVHRGHTSSETLQLIFEYIYTGRYCGGEFPLTGPELLKRGNSPVILVWFGRRGVLADIIRRFNTEREVHKKRAQTLDAAYNLVSSRIIELDSEALQAESGFGADDYYGGDAADDGWGDYDDDDDDDDAADDACEPMETEAEKTPEQLAAEARAPTDNPQNFSCATRFLSISAASTPSLHQAALRMQPNERDTLKTLLEEISVEKDLNQNRYELDKSIVSSIYGCLGKLNPMCAALITCQTRSTLLQQAADLVRKGLQVLYTDTDSIMVTGGTDDLSEYLNERYPFFIMSMKRFKRCYFVKRKTYIAVQSNGDFKYPQHVNGPAIWRSFVTFCSKQTHVTTSKDLQVAFRTFFDELYDRLNKFDTVGEELYKLISYKVRVQNHYQSNSIGAKLRDYIAREYPSMAGKNQYWVYYSMESSSTMDAVLRPTCALTSMDDLWTVNLFKFFHMMLPTASIFLSAHLTYNNYPHAVAVTKHHFVLLMLNGFLAAYIKRFGTQNGIQDALEASIDVAELDPV